MENFKKIPSVYRHFNGSYDPSEVECGYYTFTIRCEVSESTAKDILKLKKNSPLDFSCADECEPTLVITSNGSEVLSGLSLDSLLYIGRNIDRELLTITANRPLAHWESERKEKERANNEYERNAEKIRIKRLMENKNLKISDIYPIWEDCKRALGREDIADQYCDLLIEYEYLLEQTGEPTASALLVIASIMDEM